MTSFLADQFRSQEKMTRGAIPKLLGLSMSHRIYCLKHGVYFLFRSRVRIQANSSRSRRGVEPVIDPLDGAHLGQHRASNLFSSPTAL